MHSVNVADCARKQFPMQSEMYRTVLEVLITSDITYVEKYLMKYIAQLLGYFKILFVSESSAHRFVCPCVRINTEFQGTSHVTTVCLCACVTV